MANDKGNKKGMVFMNPTSIKLSDRHLMLRAIELSRKCQSEAGKISPKVGAVIAREGIIIGEAFRGEQAPGVTAKN